MICLKFIWRLAKELFSALDNIKWFKRWNVLAFHISHFTFKIKFRNNRAKRDFPTAFRLWNVAFIVCANQCAIKFQAIRVKINHGHMIYPDLKNATMLQIAIHTNTRTKQWIGLCRVWFCYGCCHLFNYFMSTYSFCCCSSKSFVKV